MNDDRIRDVTQNLADGNMVVGHGRTEQEAINSLMEALEDE